MTVPERMNFSTSSKGCWGSFSNQKIILQIFDLYTGFKEGFSEKMQYDSPKMREAGSKAAWNFSKNSSVLVKPPVPYSLLLLCHKMVR